MLLAELTPLADLQLQDIKTNALTDDDLLHMRELAGSYERLFSRRSQQYKKRKLHEVLLSEEDMRTLILEEYTFLKRPVLVFDEKIFIPSHTGSKDENREELIQFVKKVQ